MAAKKKTESSDLDSIKQRFGDVLRAKQDHERSGRSHTDAGSKVSAAGVLVQRQDFRRKTG
ncbi:MAG: DUF5302 family protein [Actinomycetota bacterium]|nr:DUF5302 family protein [Actinomycetota bacterium]